MSLEVKYLVTRWGRTSSSMLRMWWVDHGTTLMHLAVVLMAVAALVWLVYEFWRLLWQPTPIWPTSPAGAVDIGARYTQVHQWFTGGTVPDVYPPASYVILWPFLGWLPYTPAKWLWAFTSLVMLAFLIYLVIKESGAVTPLERFFVALIPLSMYATGATIGNGQLTIHILSALLAGLLLHHQSAQTGQYT